MKCRYCGHDIPDGSMRCDYCERTVQIVPDYNPLDDILAAHVKESISGREDRQSNRESAGRTGRDTGRTVGRNTGRTGRDTGRTAGRNTGRTGRDTGRTAGRNTGRTGRDAGRNTGRTGRDTGRAAGRNTGRTGRNTGRTVGTAQMRRDPEFRRRQAERRRALKRQKRRRLLTILFLFLVLIAGGITVLYLNSYGGIVGSGNRALRKKDYARAEECFQRAISKNEKRPEAYTGLSEVYIARKDPEGAEDIFLDAIEKQPDNADIYKACFAFYLDTGQAMGIPELLEGADDSVAGKLSEYNVSEPEFSLDDTKTFDDVQQLSLSSKAGTVRYTTDGSDPDTKSQVFKEPLQLGEGSNVIKAITVNKAGVPSRIAEKEFVIEFPIEDAPAVSPSTGQYDSEEEIEIRVPDGYEAYYTMDGEDPTTASTHYDGPVEMPEGETLFKAVLVSKGGRVSGVTTRNYIRE